MNTRSSVDVIIPCYNTGNYLRSAVHSILAQTVLPERIIIVDDGSTDNTASICKQLITENKTGIEIIYHYQSNAGPNVARNIGIDLSKAEYIAFLDADDIWLPQKLERQLNVFHNSNQNDLGLVYCISAFIDEDAKVFPENPVRFAMRGKIFDQLTEMNKVTGSASSVLIKRNCFDTIGGFDTLLKAYEDWDLWLRIAQKYAFDYVDEICVHIRLHNNNTQKNHSYMNRFELLFYKKWLPHVKQLSSLREWGFQLAKPSYLPFWNRAYLLELNSKLTPSEKRKLYRSTGGSLILYAWLKRLQNLIQ